MHAFLRRHVIHLDEPEIKIRIRNVVIQWDWSENALFVYLGRKKYGDKFCCEHDKSQNHQTYWIKSTIYGVIHLLPSILVEQEQFAWKCQILISGMKKENKKVAFNKFVVCWFWPEGADGYALSLTTLQRSDCNSGGLIAFPLKR